MILAAAYTTSIGLRATNGAAITGDEPFYLMTTQSLIDDGNLDLRRQYELRSYEAFFDHPEGLWRQSVRTSDGLLLSPHEPGLSVLVIPGFLVDGLRGVQVELLLIAALTFSLAFVLASLHTGNVLLSWLVTGAVGLSATPFVYATEVYPEVPAALCVVTALLLIRVQREQSQGLDAGAAAGREATGRPGESWWRLARAAVVPVLLLSALLWLGMKYAPLGSILAVGFLLVSSWKERAVFTALGAVSAVFYIWFHYAVFEDLTAYSVNTVYEGADAARVLQSHVAFQERAYRLYGLFIDERFGVGRWAPVLLLTLPALPLLLRQGLTGRLALALIGAQLLIATFVAITMMGWWFPGRTLMVVLPLFPLALASLLSGMPSLVKVVAGALAVWSIAFTVALQQAASEGSTRLAVDPFAMPWAPFRAAAHLFPDYRAWTPETVLLTGVWLVVLTAGAVAVLRRTNHHDLTASRRRVVTGKSRRWAAQFVG